MRRVKTLARTAGSLLQGVRIKKMSDLPLAIARASGSVTMTVEDEQALVGLKLWEQGDVAMCAPTVMPSNICDHS